MKISDLKAICIEDEWDSRKGLIPKSIKSSKNHSLLVSSDLFLLGWPELSMLNSAIEVERRLREIKFCMGEGCKDKQDFITLGYTTLDELLDWAKEKKIISETSYLKGKKLNKKRNCTTHSLDRKLIIRPKLDKNGDALLIVPQWLNTLCDLDDRKDATFTLEPFENKNKKRKEIRIYYKEYLNDSCVNSMRDAYDILNDLLNFSKQNKINLG